VSKKQAVFLQPHRFVDVAIVGAGFSGSMLAVHLADTFQASHEIALIEKCPASARTAAFPQASATLLGMPSTSRRSSNPRREGCDGEPIHDKTCEGGEITLLKMTQL
jgi:hypothetical protein